MITDTTFVGLVAAACTDPDSDTPRLVLADYLDDAAEYTTDPDAARAWAAYIRWDCGGRKGEEPKGLLSVIALAGWFLISPGDIEISFRRGFPDGLTTRWSTWERHGFQLSWHPDEAKVKGNTCQPTACPGVTVTLRDGPDTQYVGYDGSWTEHPDRPIFRLPGRQYRSGNDLRLGVQDDGTPYTDMRYIEWMTHVTKRLLSLEWPGVKAWHLLDVPRMVEDYQQDLINQLIRSTGIPPQLVEAVGTDYAGTVTGLRTFNERLYDRLLNVAADVE